MKKLLATLTAACTIVLTTACSAPTTKDNLKIVCTIYPEYDWVRELTAGVEDVDITLLMDSGADMHGYKPSASDIITLSNCDMFIYVGGESDSWIEDTLATANNEDLIAVNLLEVIGDAAVAEELKEGMTAPKEEEEEECYDEHVWLSLRNANTICSYLTELLADTDADNAATYKKNYNNYSSKLRDLDTRYSDTISNSNRDTIIFADRFPFRYLMEDYGLNYYAAFMGCSAETEASFETIAFLKDKVEELDVPCVLTIDGSDGSIASTVANGREVLSINSIQSTTTKSDTSYLSIMESNLEVLAKALS